MILQDEITTTLILERLFFKVFVGVSPLGEGPSDMARHLALDPEHFGKVSRSSSFQTRMWTRDYTLQIMRWAGPIYGEF